MFLRHVFAANKMLFKIHNIENSEQLLQTILELLAWGQQGQAMPGAE